ncbi:hypothetical protein L0152_24405 [bacterium]|nr:hypothetical protein [bacterium]
MEKKKHHVRDVIETLMEASCSGTEQTPRSSIMNKIIIMEATTHIHQTVPNISQIGENKSQIAKIATRPT